MQTYEEQLGESFDHLLKEADLYFSEIGKPHSTLAELTRKLEQAGISYAVLGAIALAQYGYRRMTVGIDILLSPEGLARFGSNTKAGAMSPLSAGRRSPSALPKRVFEWT